MPCSNCGAQFGIFKRKKQCQQCRFYFCNLCLKLQRNKILCAKCHILTTRPLSRSHLMQLKPRDLVLYLKSIRVSTSGCVEKEDLVNLLLANVSSGADSEHIESRRDQDTAADSSDSNPFRPNNFQNIQNIWATVQEQYENFRFRPASATYAGSTQPPRRTYTRERPPYYQPPPSPLDTQNITEGNAEPGAPGTSRIPETHDCIEIEDIGDWEFVSRTGDPLSDADPAIIEEVIHIHQEIHPPPRRANSETSIPVSVNREPGTSQPISEAEMHQSMHNLSSDSNLTLHMSDNSESMRNIMETIEAVSESEVDLNNDEVMSASSSKFRKYLKLSDIRNEEALVDLNVRQLKELLVMNRVDYKGCVEKNELLQRVTRLWQDNAQFRENLEKLSADDLCKICMDAPVECVMLECGHLATCTACGKQLNECPICRQYVVRVVRTFRA